MTNSELFKKIFGIYAEEFWAYSKEEMLDWINSDVPDTSAGDLISWRAAIDVAMQYCPDDDGLCNKAGVDIREMLDELESLPPAQSERKKGKWIKMSDADGIYWACSECGEEIPRVDDFDPQFDLFHRLKSMKKTNFCPKCGARMEE